MESNPQAIFNYCAEASEAMLAGQADRALRQLSLALSLAYDLDNPRLNAYVMNALGHAYMQTNNSPRAEQCFTSALEHATNQHPDLMLVAASGLARALKANGRPTEAIRYFQQAIQLAETQGSAPLANNLRSEMAEISRQH